MTLIAQPANYQGESSFLQHDPEQEPPDDAVEDRDHVAGLLELTEVFFRQASAQVRAELALFFTTQRGWSPRTGLHAYLDSLSFTALGVRDRVKNGT